MWGKLIVIMLYVYIFNVSCGWEIVKVYVMIKVMVEIVDFVKGG